MKPFKYVVALLLTLGFITSGVFVAPTLATVATHELQNGGVTAVKLSDHLKKGKYFFEKFSGQPLAFTHTSGVPAFASAAQGQVDLLYTAGGHYIELYQSTAQTLMPLAHATSGLEIGLDQVDNESAEYVPGGNRTTNPYAFLTGTDGDFFIRAQLEITDASGSDQLVVGFRKVQTYQVPTSFLTTGDAGYTDFAAIGFAATKANPNPVKCATDLNDSGSTTVSATGFTWADTKIHELMIEVIARVPHYYINGVELGGTVSYDATGTAITAQATTSCTAYLFDSGDTVEPFVFVREDADLTDAVYLKELEIGPISAKRTARR